MSDTSKPVWVWLPRQCEPVRCGVFSLVAGTGVFAYDDVYKSRSDALALDPMHLPITRSNRAAKERKQGGLFGVFRDVSPEGFGLSLLEQVKGMQLPDPMQRLEFSEGDSVGAIEICDDIEAKLAFRAPGSDELFEVLTQLQPQRPSSQAVREVRGLHGTSLGGERPKMTVLHEGQLWIAKLQDRGDPPHAPLREYVAMRMAASFGLQVAPVQFHRVGGRGSNEREVVLVKRFDRHVDDDGRTTRMLYASAHTVLRLNVETRGDRARSYVGLAHELQRWCSLKDGEAAPLKRELWRRMAFNALCGNGDDHPRNHGLICRDGRWGLSEAFDIAPYITFSGTLAMAITRDGSGIATTANLLSHVDNFGYEAEEARAWLMECRQAMETRWVAEVEACGYKAEALPFQAPTWLDGG